MLMEKSIVGIKRRVRRVNNLVYGKWYTLTLDIGENGSVEVNGVAYETGEHEILLKYIEPLTLVAIADEDYEINEWGGDLSGSELEKELVMVGNASVSVSFIAIYDLDITAVGGGSVEVEWLEEFYVVSEGSDNFKIPAGALVTLTAIDDEETFLEWSGSISGSENPAGFEMNDNKNITATFGTP